MPFIAQIASIRIFTDLTIFYTLDTFVSLGIAFGQLVVRPFRAAELAKAVSSVPKKLGAAVGAVAV